MVVVAVRDPYDIAYFTDAPTYLATYSTTAISMESLARVLFGEVQPAGKLPVDDPGGRRPGHDALPVRPRPGVHLMTPEHDMTESTNGSAAARASDGGLSRRPRRDRRSASAAGPVLAGPAAAAPRATPAAARSVRTGVEVLIASDYEVLRGQKVGIVTNPTGVLPDLTHEVDVMAASDEVDLVAVFGPEHGFRGTAQAGGSEGIYVDERTGLPV